MKNIVLTRIDDRLIHGQVVTAWVKQTKGNRIVIVDDALSKDDFMQKIMRAAAPSGITVEIYSIDSAAEFLSGVPEADERVLILVKTPQVIEALAEKGVDTGAINLGGMGAKAGREKFHRNISASEEEVACMKRLVDKGRSITMQLVPDERPVDVKGIL
jgi:mannose/fructose/N-acetylgalactosamine-specific phosphotransferase system component IIB